MLLHEKKCRDGPRIAIAEAGELFGAHSSKDATCEDKMKSRNETGEAKDAQNWRCIQEKTRRPCGSFATQQRRLTGSSDSLSRLRFRMLCRDSRDGTVTDCQ